jgi:hypothetical protein
MKVVGSGRKRRKEEKEVMKKEYKVKMKIRSKKTNEERASDELKTSRRKRKYAEDSLEKKICFDQNC